MKILLTLPRNGDGLRLFSAETLTRLERGGEVILNPHARPPTADELRAALPGCVVCVTGWGTPRLTETILEGAAALRLVAHVGGSIAPLGPDALYRRGIHVCSANRILARHTAEGILAYLLSALRDIPHFDRALHEGAPWPRDVTRPQSLRAQRIGFVGLGTVGRHLLDLLAPFEVTVAIYDPYVKTEELARWPRAKLASLDHVLSESTVVSLHAARTGETINLLNRERLRRLRVPASMCLRRSRCPPRAGCERCPMSSSARTRPAPGYLTDIFADRAIAWISRERTRPYFLYVPFTAPHDPYQGPDDGPAPVPWGKGNRDVYRKMVEHLDRRIGDVLAAIDRSPSGRNTVVVFLSDNGGTLVGSNKPLRGNKSTLWEGGIRVPCLIRWPAAIPAGRETAQVGQNIDLAATLLAAAGIAPGASLPLDGVSFLPVLRGESPPFPRTAFWRYKRGENRRKAVLDGDYKLVIDNGTMALMNLAKDPQEKENLVNTMPGKMRELEAKILAWEKEVASPRLREFLAATPAASARAPVRASREQ